MNPFVIALRRIIYSIPLKRLLFGLAVFGVLFASFSNADFTCTPSYVSSWNGNSSSQEFGVGRTYSLPDGEHFKMYCLTATSYPIKFKINCQGSWIDLALHESYCLYYDTSITRVCTNTIGNTAIIGYSYWNTDCLDQTYSSMKCQTEYNLIPISSVDQNYCTTNNLCPAGGIPSDCPNVGVSNLYINDLFHPGAFNIIMNIPEEIDWDYAYTNSGQNFNLDVVGYNQNFEAIEGWIATNNYKPTSEDFTNIFTNFSNFGGLLIGALFVILVFYFVKKMFK